MQPQDDNAPNLEDQFQIYAKELGELFRAEQERRAELAEEKLVLELRVKELEALNRMFQTHLARRIELEDAIRSMVAQLKALAEDQSLPAMHADIARIALEAETRILMESLPGADQFPGESPRRRVQQGPDA